VDPSNPPTQQRPSGAETPASGFAQPSPGIYKAPVETPANYSQPVDGPPKDQWSPPRQTTVDYPWIPASQPQSTTAQPRDIINDNTQDQKSPDEGPNTNKKPKEKPKSGPHSTPQPHHRRNVPDTTNPSKASDTTTPTPRHATPEPPSPPQTKPPNRTPSKPEPNTTHTQRNTASSGTKNPDQWIYIPPAPASPDRHPSGSTARQYTQNPTHPIPQDPAKWIFVDFSPAQAKRGSPQKHHGSPNRDLSSSPPEHQTHKDPGSIPTKNPPATPTQQAPARGSPRTPQGSTKTGTAHPTTPTPRPSSQWTAQWNLHTSPPSGSPTQHRPEPVD